MPFLFYCERSDFGPGQTIQIKLLPHKVGSRRIFLTSLLVSSYKNLRLADTRRLSKFCRTTIRPQWLLGTNAGVAIIDVYSVLKKRRARQIGTSTVCATVIMMKTAS